MLAFALQAVAAFNLVCTGTFTRGVMPLRIDETRPAQVTLRVDLEQGRWCSGECQTTAPIFRVSDTFIIFSLEGDVMRPNSTDLSDHSIYVNRESGEFTDRQRFYIAPNFHYSMTMARCERAPFTGFPQRRF